MRISAEHDAANTAYQEELGEPDPEFAEMRWPLSLDNRDQAVRDVEVAIIMRDYRGRRDISADEYADVARKATNLVDRRVEFRKRSDEIFERIVANVDKRWEDALDKLHDAREALFKTPAPDADALLFKLDILCAYLTESGSEDAGRIVVAAHDTRRLLTVGRA